MQTRSSQTVGLPVCLLGSCLGLGGGCAREYRIEQPTYEAAFQLAHTVGADRVAVQANPVDADPAAPPVYVRAASIQRLSPPSGRHFEVPPVLVRAPDTKKEKEIGRALLIIGGVSLLGIAAVLAYDLAPYESPSGELPLGHIPLTLFAGPPLALVGIGLTIPGIILTVKGARPPSELPPGRRDLRYVSDPRATAP